MIAVRLSKIVLVAALALTCTLVVFGNVVDPSVNLSFVQHVLSMDTVLPGSGVADRSITNPTLQRAAFGLIVAGEALTALLLWLGALLMLIRLRSTADIFGRARSWAIAGLSIGFLVWQAGFLGIGGEWFGMWMSKEWNGQESAFRFAMTVLGVLIYVSLPEGPAPVGPPTGR
jgi:predicted small integral membrane protein